jgi:hypothetical protein
MLSLSGVPASFAASLQPFFRACCGSPHPRSFAGTLKRIVTF